MAEPAPDPDPGAAGPPPPGAAPALRVPGWDGPLDDLVAGARAGRVDLRRLPLPALVGQCAAAVEAALAARPARVPLHRAADWLVMAAWLAWLRSGLLLPAEREAGPRDDRAEAERLGRLPAERAAMRAAADWLEARPRLGRDVFGPRSASLRGAAGPGGRGRRGRGVEVTLAALLAVYLGPRRVRPSDATAVPAGAPARPRPPPLPRVPEALARLRRRLPGLAAGGAAVALAALLPAAGRPAAAAAATAPLRRRAAAASTFVAALELARAGEARLEQDTAFGPVRVGPPAAAAGATGPDPAAVGAGAPPPRAGAAAAA